MTSDVALRARLEQQALLAQFAGKIGDAGRAKRGDGALRLAVGEIDHRQARSDLRTRGAFEPLVDLVLQELGGLIEQIDGHQPIGETADHLVAAPADRRQVAIFVEHSKRVDRRKVVALRTEKELRKQRRRRILALAGNLQIGRQKIGDPHRAERLGKAAGVGIDARQHFQRLHFERVAAPGDRQRLELAQRIFLADFVAPLLQRDLQEPASVAAGRSDEAAARLYSSSASLS